VKKPLDTIELATATLGLLKSFGIVFAMVLIEWARARQRLAEGKQAVAESELSISTAKGVIDEQNRDKSSHAIVAEYLAKDSNSPGQ
jgi:hypothetical protein